MWLEYGINDRGEFISVDQVRRGRTALSCPYCGGSLTAKKGERKQHHFAHTGETCRAVAANRDITLPLYDQFNLYLAPKAFEALKKLWRSRDCDYQWRKALERQGLIEWNPYKGRTGGYEFTHLGKIPLGELSLMLFNQEQEWLILDKLSKLERKVEQAQGFTEPSPDLPDYLVDLKLYRFQLRRILAQTLYYLDVQADEQTLFKIGVTTRPIEERVAEIEQDLRSHFSTIIIKVLGTWEHRGNVERYFLHRYQYAHFQIGTLQEYFKFESPDEAKAALRDLRRMKPKILKEVEQDILAGKLSQIEQAIAATQQAEQRSLAIKRGMDQAKQSGIHVGRPLGKTETDTEFLAKPASQQVIQALQEGLSIRAAAQRVGVSPNTVQKVRSLMSEL